MCVVVVGAHQIWLPIEELAQLYKPINTHTHTHTVYSKQVVHYLPEQKDIQFTNHHFHFPDTTEEEKPMAWCAATRSFHFPAIDVHALRNRAPLAVGFGCVSMVGANSRRTPSPPFASLGISTTAGSSLATFTNYNLLC